MFFEVKTLKKILSPLYITSQIITMITLFKHFIVNYDLAAFKGRKGNFS